MGIPTDNAVIGLNGAIYGEVDDIHFRIVSFSQNPEAPDGAAGN